MITRLVAVAYDKEAQCPEFEKFLNRTFQEKESLITYMQNLVGYCLSGLTKEHAFWFFYGPTNTSKSTFVELLRLLCGEYGTTIPKNAIVVDKFKNQDHALAELAGARMATNTELTSDQRLDEAAVKMITGQDPIKACKKYENFFEFRSTAKLVLATNDRPVIKDTDAAIWNRVKSIPFLVQIPPSERIDRYAEQLIKAEGPGILAWAVRGFQNWQQYGLQEPIDITAETTRYRDEQDAVRGFIEEECEEHAELKEKFSTLYERYSELAKQQKMRPMSRKRFGQELDRLGHIDDRSNGIHYRLGLKAVSEVSD